MTTPWVELRVHGVSGTPPESMLDFAHVRQVGGDEFGRYFRRFAERGEELPGPDGQIVEAYHWGKFTSGSWSQAIWLLLAPFGIVNAAQFTLEPPSSRRARLAFISAGAMLRLVGVSLTVLFVLGTAVISLDLWAWQRIDLSTSWRDRLIASAALLAPVALLLMCFSLGRSRLVGTDDSRYEPPARSDTAVAESDAGYGGSPWLRVPPSDLVRPGLLGGDARAPALRLVHLATGLAVVAVLGFAPRRNLDDAVALWGFWISYALAAACVVGVMVLGDPERSASVALERGLLRRVRDAIQRRSLAGGRALAGLGGLLVLAAVGHGLVAPTERDHSVTHYPGVELLANLTMAAAMVGMVGLLITNGLLAHAERDSVARRGNRRFAPFAGGYAAILLASLGIFVGLGYVGAFGVTAAKGFETETRQVVAPELMTRIVYTWGLMIFVLVAVVVAFMIRRRVSLASLEQRVLGDFTREDGVRLPPRWIKHVAAAMWSARLKNTLVPVLTVFTVVGWSLSAATGWELLPLLWGGDLWILPGVLTWLSQPVSVGDPLGGFITWLGTLTLSGLAAGLLFVGRTSIGGEATRRSVNVLWDVIAFWPRSAHPFVPPAYAQRAVKDVERRLAWHLDQTLEARVRYGEATAPERDVVLCAHSQGSLVSFAALLRIGRGTAVTSGPTHGPADLARIGFLTFGSQLQVLFSRAFPAYVNLPTIAWLNDQLHGAWRNFYRDTDYLAGPVLSWLRRTPDAGWFGEPPPAWPAAPPPSGGGRGEQEFELGVPPPIGPEGRTSYGSDWRLLDPPIPDLGQPERPLAALRRHSDYWTDDAWPDALKAVRHTPPRRGPDPAPAAAPPPDA